MALAVEVADGVSNAWRRRFMRTSAALGEEAITSDVLLCLEEDLAPFVRRVQSFTRAQEGGTHGPATGADFEVHFFASGGVGHLGYRVQAKLAKQDYSPAVFTYDFGYTTGGGVSQIDALVSSARSASCIPMYFLYNSPAAVGELLAQYSLLGPFPGWRWGRGCWHEHVARFDAALTIATVPARLARRAAVAASRRLTDATAVSDYMAPWSCLFHQQRLSRQLTLEDLRDQVLARLDWIDRWSELTTEELEALDEERIHAEEYLGQAQAPPEDVVRLAEGDPGFTFSDLVRARRGIDIEGDESGDSALASMLIVELEE